MCEACEEDEAFFRAYYAKMRGLAPQPVAPRAFSAESTAEPVAASGFGASPASSGLTNPVSNRPFRKE